ncbi:Hypothetical protein NTJ_04760 [Nesidiocoris tenuis]|nr:Hypothetical protein NTJ_04760 [Nesidiocoris tenuis]
MQKVLIASVLPHSGRAHHSRKCSEYFHFSITWMARGSSTLKWKGPAREMGFWSFPFVRCFSTCFSLRVQIIRQIHCFSTWLPNGIAIVARPLTATLIIYCPRQAWDEPVFEMIAPPLPGITSFVGPV